MPLAFFLVFLVFLYPFLRHTRLTSNQCTCIFILNLAYVDVQVTFPMVFM